MIDKIERSGVIMEDSYGGDTVCGATLNPLHLHNTYTSVGNMNLVDILERKLLTFIFLYFIACLVLDTVLVTYLLLPTHVF